MSELKVYRDPKDGPAYREFYEKSEADKVIAELKSDVADLRDDKKLTDAILDERNAEIAELKDKLQAANEQIENLINSASSIMLFQDRVKDNKCAELRHHKYKRCLAMAKWCMARYNEWVAYYPTTTTRKMKFLDKWEKCWRELAAEPTWAKFLQLIRKEAK